MDPGNGLGPFQVSLGNLRSGHSERRTQYFERKAAKALPVAATRATKGGGVLSTKHLVRLEKNATRSATPPGSPLPGSGRSFADNQGQAKPQIVTVVKKPRALWVSARGRAWLKEEGEL